MGKDGQTETMRQGWERQTTAQGHQAGVAATEATLQEGDQSRDEGPHRERQVGMAETGRQRPTNR